jgi:Na+-driven multidrug efflux pump
VTTTINANRQIARAAGTVMLAILFGQLMGLARGIVVANVFGASLELDSFYAANRVSETLFLLVAGGALGSAFIPTFTGLLTKGDKTAAWRLASALANAVILTLNLLAVLIAFFAPQVVRYALAPGLSAEPEIFNLTVSMLRIQLISAVLFGLGGLIVGVLNAHQVFLVPALTPAMYQLGIIFGAVFLAPSMGIYGLAWGVIVGAVLYLLIQIPSLLRQKGAYTPTLDLHDPNTRQVFLLMLPRLLGVAVVQLNFWVNTNLASRMEEGSVASLTYGFSLMLMAQAAIAQSVAIAAMPTFSAQHALGKKDEMRSSLAASLRGIFLWLSRQHRFDDPARTVDLIPVSTRRVRRAGCPTGGVGAALVRGRAGRPLDHGGADARLLRPTGHENARHHRHGCNGVECAVQHILFRMVRADRLVSARWAGPGKLLCHRARSDRVVHLHAQTPERDRGQVHCGWRMARWAGRAGDGGGTMGVDSGHSWDEPRVGHAGRRRVGRGHLSCRSRDSQSPRGENDHECESSEG